MKKKFRRRKKRKITKEKQKIYIKQNYYMLAKPTVWFAHINGVYRDDKKTETLKDIKIFFYERSFHIKLF